MSRWDLTCISGKRPYRDRTEAYEALAAVRRRRKRRAEREVYRCPHCGSWHLASPKPKWKKPERPYR